ncbi:MAG: FliM/FliN family flagellar motor switch protein [Candidatus Acidiferrum sp.]|jgi:flagellar motor switch protein FliM
MRRVLTQEEIDALFSAAQPGQQAESTQRKKNVEKCDLSKSKTLSAEQIRVVNTLHETFARRMSDSLGTYLRTGCEIDLVAAEHLRYSEFLGRVPELSYLASLRMLPIDAGALVLLDLSLVFPIVDLALGGSGGDVTDPREPTEIEEQIIETAVGLIARDLQTAWATVVSFDIQFDQRQPLAQAHALMLPNEKILAFNFEIRLLDLRGALHIALPAVVANALLRKLGAPGSLGERIPSRNTRRKIRENLLKSSFLVDLSLPESPLSVRELLNIKADYVLVMPNRAEKAVHLNIAGKPMFEANPVRRGSCKGARIEKRVSLIPPPPQV